MKTWKQMYVTIEIILFKLHRGYSIVSRESLKKNGYMEEHGYRGWQGFHPAYNLRKYGSES